MKGSTFSNDEKSKFKPPFDYQRRKQYLKEDLFELPELPKNDSPFHLSNHLSNGASANAVIINTRQRENPIIQSIRNVKLEYGDSSADYVIGKKIGILFLSIKYHRLHPDYIYHRMNGLGSHFDLKALLVLVDVDDYITTNRELSSLSMKHSQTLILAWTEEECAKYIEMYKVLENHSTEPLLRKQDLSYLAKLTEILTQIRGVNKTDVLTLSATYGSFDKIVEASADSLARCPGIGHKKAQRIYDAFRAPFKGDNGP